MHLIILAGRSLLASDKSGTSDPFAIAEVKEIKKKTFAYFYLRVHLSKISCKILLRLDLRIKVTFANSNLSCLLFPTSTLSFSLKR